MEERCEGASRIGLGESLDLRALKRETLRWTKETRNADIDTETALTLLLCTSLLQQDLHLDYS